MFPEGEQRGPVSHRRRDAVVLPRGRPLPRASPATARRCGSCCPTLRRHRRAPHRAARASASASIPRDGLLRAGRRGLSAHLDGREGRRLGGDAAARQGGRDQRALVQRAAAARGVAARGAATPTAASRSASTPSGRARRSTSASGTRRAATCTTSSTASTATTRRAGPNQVFAISLPHPVLDARALGAGARRRARAAADAGRPALARARPSRLQAALLRRPARARRRLSPGHGLGLADRPVRRRLAEGASRRPRRRARARSTGSTRTSSEACVGSISEIFDAEAPFTPRGCIAQAWSVAEVLRVIGQAEYALTSVTSSAVLCTRFAMEMARRNDGEHSRRHQPGRSAATLAGPRP